MAVRVGGLYRVKDVIDQACAQGCEVRQSKALLAGPDGPRHIRYLLRPSSGQHFDITDYKDDEFMMQSEVDALERRLGVAIAA